MGRKAKTKITYGESTKELFEKVNSTLSARGAKGYDLGDLIELIVTSAPSSVIDKYLHDNTPMEFKLKQLLASESASKELDRLVKKHNFGLTTEPDQK